MKKFTAFILFCFLAMGNILSAETIHLFLIGPGLVGGELIQQIYRGFSGDQATEVRVVGIANHRTMYFDPAGIPLDNWHTLLTQSKETLSLEVFTQRMQEMRLPRSVFVDCTSNPAVADLYASILQGKIAIVTPNKKANSGPYPTYITLKKLAAENQVKFLYDANVGAGLPIIHTIQSMRRGGDTIVKVEAILSGTLSYLFNTFDGSTPFSEVVRQAQKMGYTEPDPRDDLNGMDMARKFLILARESGLTLEMKDVAIKRFLPESCFDAATVAEFYQKLSEYDQELSAMAIQAKQEGKVLRFMGTLENGRASLSLQAIGSEHPFYQLSDTNNIASITSHYYCKNPVVIKGPRAGASITAASVLSNVIQAGLER